MSHEAKIVEKRQISNEFVAYRIVCCEQACGQDCMPHAHVCEDSWHTVSIHRDDHEGYLEERKAEVVARHEKMSAWREKHGLNA